MSPPRPVPGRPATRPPGPGHPGRRHVVVVGASAGGVEALQVLVAGLPADLPCAVVVVLHIPRNSPSALAPILARSGRLPVRAAVDGAPLAPGVVHVAPADRHLLVDREGLRLATEPTGTGHRPAVDPLFCSAAAAFGPDTVAVVLSGAGDDGAAGAAAVAERGGTVLVQQPGDAAYPDMPGHALERVPGAATLPVARLGEAIAALLTAQG